MQYSFPNLWQLFLFFFKPDYAICTNLDKLFALIDISFCASTEKFCPKHVTVRTFCKTFAIVNQYCPCTPQNNFSSLHKATVAFFL